MVQWILKCFVYIRQLLLFMKKSIRNIEREKKCFSGPQIHFRRQTHFSDEHKKAKMKWKEWQWNFILFIIFFLRASNGRRCSSVTSANTFLGVSCVKEFVHLRWQLKLESEVTVRLYRPSLDTQSYVFLTHCHIFFLALWDVICYCWWGCDNDVYKSNKLVSSQAKLLFKFRCYWDARWEERFRAWQVNNLHVRLPLDLPMPSRDPAVNFTCSEPKKLLSFNLVSRCLLKIPSNIYSLFQLHVSRSFLFLFNTFFCLIVQTAKKLLIHKRAARNEIFIQFNIILKQSERKQNFI